MKLINGGGEIVAQLEELLALAKSGEIDGIAFTVCPSEEQGAGWGGYAYRADMEYPLARLVASSAMLFEGLKQRT